MTADLRREEIARPPLTAEEERDLREWMVSDAYPEDGWRSLSMFGVVDRLLATLDAVRSQDTATARIAALNVAALRDAIESVPCQSAQPPGHRPVIDWADLERLRAVLSGETRTDGETE